MRTLSALLLLPLVAVADIDRDRLNQIDAAAAAALRRGDCPGAVVLGPPGGDGGFRTAYGDPALHPEKVRMSADTVFDMASLTKPVATATSAFVLIERGKLKLSENVATYWP